MNQLYAGYILNGLITSTLIFIGATLILDLVISLTGFLKRKHDFWDLFKSNLLVAMLFSYCLAFVYSTLIDRGNAMTNGAVLVPFVSVPTLISQGSNGWVLLITSIAVGIPFGILIPMNINKAKKWWITAVLTGIFALIIETIQLATGRGVFNIDDILLLVIGSCLGYSFCYMFRKNQRLSMN